MAETILRTNLFDMSFRFLDWPMSKTEKTDTEKLLPNVYFYGSLSNPKLYGDKKKMLIPNYYVKDSYLECDTPHPTILSCMLVEYGRQLADK